LPLNYLNKITNNQIYDYCYSHYQLSKTNLSYYEAQNFCKNYSIKYFDELYLILNKINKVDLSRRFWYPVIFPFIYKYVSMMYDKYVSLNHIPPKAKMFNLLHKKDYYTPISNSDFSIFGSNDYGALQMMSQYYKTVKGDHKSYNYENINKFKINELNNKDHLKNYNLKNLGYIISNKLSHKIYNNNTKTEILFHGCYQSQKALYLLYQKLKNRIGVLEVIEKNHSTIKVNKTKRQILENEIKSESAFDNYLAKSIKFFLPKNYLELFHSNYSHSKNTIAKYSNLRSIVCENWLNNDEYAFSVGVAKEQGARHIHSQHSYQFPNKSNFHWMIELCCDRVITTGWKIKNSKKIIQGGVNKDFKVLKRRRTKNTRILYVSTGGWRYPVMFYDILSGKDFFYYNKQQIKFFENLPENIKMNLLVRKPIGIGWDFKINQKNINIDSEPRERLTQAMQKARITIIDHISTGYGEALFMNVPCIIIKDSKLFPTNKIFNEDFKKLKSVGVIHDNFESAASFLVEVYDKTFEWWYSREVQGILSSFRNKNLRSIKYYINSVSNL